MGGSSLGPAVFGLSFPQQFCWPRFHLLDSTDPAQIGATAAALDLRRTLVIVSSKSGDTLETSLLLDYFWHEVALLSGVDKAGRQFVAVTDAGSPLQARAKKLGFSQVFHGLSGIGGRYSVLSKFGTVVAAGLGLDVKRLLQATLIMQRSCGPDVPPAENPGVALGIALGIAATRFGRDKVTILADDNIGNLGAWLEQLLAESTGKQGRGLIPLTDEPLVSPKYYGDDRFFLSFERHGYHDPVRQQALDALEAAGHPVVHIGVADIWQIGQEFFRLEIATAVAGAIIGINPFDQPDVEAGKVRTLALLGDGHGRPQPAEQPPLFHENGLALFADPGNAQQLGRHNSLVGYLRSHFARLHAGDYAALLAYLPRNDVNGTQLNRMRRHIRDRTHAATCLGFGPRFQHSTGQVYKGGPNTGVFLQITCDDPVDIAVPGQDASFGRIKAAEAEGDLAVLIERDRRVLRVHLKHSDPGLVQLTDAVVSALA
jgi:transaldolase/glucose-6-phosphate isomerase